MDILMVTPELSPYARASRTGDTVAALSKALCQLEHRVTVAVPRHPGFEASGLLVARRLTPLELPGGGGGQITVLDGQLPTGAKLVLFDGPAPAAAGALPDEASFVALCRAAAALVKQRADRGEPFDAVHLHDFPSALTAVLLRNAGSSPPCVVTVHDGGERGIVSEEHLAGLGVDRASVAACREGTGVSVLSLGVRAADAVTSVSPAVAAELGDMARFGSLARVLAEGSVEVLGVLSGLDYATVNPATDSALKNRYDAEDVSNKGSSKTELLRSRGLDLEPARPLIVAIVEGAGESGAELLEEAIPALLRNDVTLIVLVRGNPAACARLEEQRRDFLDRMAIIDGTGDEPLARRACAAADLVVLPRLYESTGVLSRIAQRYGALPVVRAVGAHLDTVVDCDAALETGTGFVFDAPTAEALTGAVARGVGAYLSARWPSLRRRVMRLDLSWDRAARRYVQVYKQVIVARTKPVAV